MSSRGGRNLASKTAVREVSPKAPRCQVLVQVGLTEKPKVKEEVLDFLR